MCCCNTSRISTKVVAYIAIIGMNYLFTSHGIYKELYRRHGVIIRKRQF